jgi:hypothetical protein
MLMFQRTCHRPKSALELAVLAIRRRGVPFHGVCPPSVLTAFLAEHVLPADKALAAYKAHLMLGASVSVDPSLAPLLAGSRLTASRHSRWPASADAGDAAARTV